MPHVSVVIPAYNAANFLVDAYRSVVGQTIDSWEVIFVNDGSQDNTLSIIRSLEAADKRVKVVDLAINSGPALARNAALSIAEGDWIAILDADDRFSRERLEVLTHTAERTGADVVLDNQFVVDPISGKVVFLAFEPNREEVSFLRFSDFLRNTQSNTVFDFGYLKPIFKRHWLLSNRLKYRENLRLGEDSMLLFECYARHAKVILVSKPYYFYNFQYSHISRTVSPTTRTKTSCEPLLTATERFIEENHSGQSHLERQLVASACEALREIIIAEAFRGSMRKIDIKGAAACLRHPVRLARGIYFDKRRSFLLQRRANKGMQVEGSARVYEATAHDSNSSKGLVKNGKPPTSVG
jgi:succinoglycan biosynthesis protein ExoO